MKLEAACWNFLLGIAIGNGQGISASSPDSRKIDVQIDAPGVKVDVKGQKKEP